MFSNLSLFTHIKCPEEETCRLINCMFSHVCKETLTLEETTLQPDPSHVVPSKHDISDTDRPAKRRRIKHPIPSKDANLRNDHPKSVENPLSSSLKTVSRDVSPPPLRDAGRSATKTKITNLQTPSKNPSLKVAEPKEVKTEPLLPRQILKPPASHALRLKLITLLHEQVARLNKEVISSKDEYKHALELSPQEIVCLVLDEELKAAREAAAVYANVLKMRIGALKKMKFEGWKEERMLLIAKSQPQAASSNATQEAVSLEISLSIRNQVEIVKNYAAHLNDLTNFGYVAEPPNGAEIDMAREGLEATHGWEQCDRCNSRFQVFPGRREEDGALTTGGGCTYHYGKLFRPQREKTDSAPKESTFTCCSQAQGTSGCTQANSHVFKVSEAKRLASIMPFMKTTTNGPQASAAAVCFDCEMGYTTFGMELTRLTAVSWPDGRQLIDILVRPLGEVLDLNSRFSGVWPRHYEETPRYGSTAPESKRLEKCLVLVDSPYKARELLLRYLTKDTPLMGHALENDLNAVRLVHPVIIDTVLLYPHPRGLPIRQGLKALVKRHLNRDIQMGGAQGHDSKEDAQAAGDLIRKKVKETWSEMKRAGWRMVDGTLKPPSTTGKVASPAASVTLV